MLWFNGKKVKKEEIPPEILAHRDKYQAIVEPLLRLEPIRNYNDLIPPSNPLYPWKANGWEVLCYYCNEPITIGHPEAHYRQRSFSPRGWRHTSDDSWACDLNKIRTDIDLPHCHVCGVRTPPHGGFCSVGGPPPFHATPMSQKEDEVTRWAERERGEEMHNALFDLLQVYEGKPSYQRQGLSLNEAVRHVLKASPWGHAVK
jgi:hypothetical protein